jgi:hypothetical protein
MKALLRVVLASLALAVLSPGVEAQPKQQRIRGTITGLEGDVLAVKTREGREVKVHLAEKLAVAAAKATTLAELKQGAYVGVTTRKREDGALVALEVHTLAPAVPQGFRPWDLAPDTMMTNANLTSVAQVTGGQEISVQYKEGAQKILVPPGTPVVTTVPADRAALKPGEYVFFAATVEADGKLSTGRIQVSRDGVRPPQ